MLFAFVGIDKPNSAALRASLRPSHIEYLHARESQVHYSGAFLAEDGVGRLGSLMIVDTDDRVEAERFFENEPYAKGGLFAETKFFLFFQGHTKLTA